MKTLFLIKLNLFFAAFSFVFLLNGDVFAGKSAIERRDVNLHIKASRKLVEQIDRIADTYVRLHRFNGSVLVAKDDKLVFSKGYGLANIESKIPITTRTIFNLGSLSKQFTAAAILKLESEGKLSVSDTIDKYLPDYPQPQGSQITIHHLLTHTSGIPSLGRRDGVTDVEADANPISVKRLLSVFSGKELQFAPGSKYQYSNSGYTVLAAIIESASGMNYGDYLKLKLFAPAGMQDTSYLPQDSLKSRTAVGYTGFYPQIERAIEAHPTWSLGGGSIYSTVEDLFKWNKALSAEKILSAGQLEKFFKPHVQRTVAGKFYGYGWFIEQFRQHPVIRHNGTSDGTIAEYYRYPKENLLVVVLSNVIPELGVNTPAEIGQGISALMFGEEYKTPPLAIKLKPENLNRYIGQYEFAPGFRLKVELKNNQLIATTEGEEAWSLATYPTQRKLDKSEKINQAVAIIQAFAKGDTELIRTFLPEPRRKTFSMQMVNNVKRPFEELGNLVKISPYDVVNDRSFQYVLSRIIFPKGERQMRIEFNEKGELGGWGIESAIPASFPLIAESPTRFFVDGFAYSQPDIKLEFILEGNNVKEIILKNKDEDLSGVKK